MKLLICGDSFASDWRTEYPNSIGWPTLLEKHFEIINLAQAGCSEYKILKQLMSINLNQFDKILISHTSPYRLYIKNHPVHKEGLHKDSDLIYTDIKEHSNTNQTLLPLVNFFEKFMDLEYMEFIHNLICKEIDSISANYSVIHFTHFEWDNLYCFKNFENYNHVYKKNSGKINHYNEIGNFTIYKNLLEKL
jgi:hypothetical protein